MEPKTVEEDESKQSWKPATPSLDSDALRCVTHLAARASRSRFGAHSSLTRACAHDCRSAERKPEDFVFLLVRKADGAWHFPQAPLNEGETIRQVRACDAQGYQPR